MNLYEAFGKTGLMWNTSQPPFINMRLYGKIVSQKSEPTGKSWTESRKSCHVRRYWGFLAVRPERHARSERNAHIEAKHGLHTPTQRRVCLRSSVWGVGTIGQAWRPPAQRGHHRCLSVSQHGWGCSINNTHTHAHTHAGPQNKTRESLTAVCCHMSEKDCLGSDHILLALFLHLHLLIGHNLQKFSQNTYFVFQIVSKLFSDCDEAIISEKNRMLLEVFFKQHYCFCTF